MMRISLIIVPIALGPFSPEAYPQIWLGEQHKNRGECDVANKNKPRSANKGHIIGGWSAD